MSDDLLRRANATDPPALYTAAEAAALLRVKQSWLERQAAARKIPFTMLGHSYRFTPGHLAAIVEMYETDPVETVAMSISSARTRRSRHDKRPAPGSLRARPRGRGNAA